MDIDTNNYSNRSNKNSYLYRFYFVMKIPEPTANEKVTIKFMKSFINGGDLVSPCQNNIICITSRRMNGCDWRQHWIGLRVL